MIRSFTHWLAPGLAGLLISCAQQEQEQTNQVQEHQATAQELCYLQVTKGQPTASGAGTKPVIDSLQIRLLIRDGQVSGTLHWLPAEKDRMTGTLAGTLQDSTITAIYSYQAEGVQAREEKVFKLAPGKIWLKSGELQEQDGVWVLQDKEKAPYVQAVPQVVCW